ncbi:MAG: Zn-dependent exopeptidase M28 [bacterium]|nr:Zn-dependent exopeptidase M28 [bacterium]
MILSLVFSICACQGPPADAEATLAAGVSDERAKRTVQELVALGPRMGGTSSGAKAAAYRGRRFEAAGLSTVVIEDGEKWVHSQEKWSVTATAAGTDGAEAESLELARAWPYGFSPSASGTATLVLDTAASEGQAVLQSRYRRARRGTTEPALVLVDGATTRDGSYPVVRSIRRGTEAPVFGIARGEGERLRGWLDAGRKVEVRYTLIANNVRGKPRTVVATLPARAGAAPGYFLYCAHGDSDSGGPGANDNASGEAIVLEIASAWADAIKAGAVPAPTREVRFAIWGSEIFSTREYVNEHMDTSAPILGVINYDQAGFGSGAEQLNLEPDDVPANVPMVRTVLAVLDDFGGKEGFPERWATNKSLGGTDSYVFSGSKRFRSDALPALTLFTSAWGSPEEHPRTDGMPGESWTDRERVTVDYDNYYHSAGDLPENTTDKEPHNMGWCARVGLLAGRRYLEALDE